MIPLSSYSALLYMNDDFEGGEFIFTEMDAKTVTVSKPILYFLLLFKYYRCLSFFCLPPLHPTPAPPQTFPMLLSVSMVSKLIL